MNDFANDYRQLDLAPGCSLSALKAARRRLVKSWHPDHFPGGSAEKRRAEERIKEINIAFDRLLDYHRRFGALPPASTATPETTLDPTPAAGASAPPPNRSTPTNRPSNKPDSRGLSPRAKISRPLRWAIALVAVILLNETIRTNVEPEPASDDTQESTEASPAQQTARSEPPANAAPIPQRFFKVGSTIDDVYSIQGPPTFAENGVWHYGKSKIYFTNGVVTSWESSSANPLSVPPPPPPEPQIFTIGSTKAEVRKLQGSPLVETDTLWDYGLSKVYFREDRVVGWDSSPLKPLKARR